MRAEAPYDIRQPRLDACARVQAAAAALAEGRPAVVIEEQEGRTRGFLCLAASETTAANLAHVASKARGFISAAVPDRRLRELGLEVPGDKGGGILSVRDARSGASVATGADRWGTLRRLADPGASPADFQPHGDVLIVSVQDGGVLAVPGGREAGVDLCRIVSLPPVAVTAEMLSTNGHLADLPQIREYARRTNVPQVRVQDVAHYRYDNEQLVAPVTEVSLPLEAGAFRGYGWRSLVDGVEYMAVVYGNPRPEVVASVLVQRPCVGLVFRGVDCSCREGIEASLAAIREAGCGAVIYPEGPIRFHQAAKPPSADPGEIEVQVLRALGFGLVEWLPATSACGTRSA